MRFCQECGYKCDENMKFCPSCGTKLSEIKSDDLKKTQETQTNQTEDKTNNNTPQSFQQTNSDNVENNFQDAGVVIDTPAPEENKKDESSKTWNYNTDSTANQQGSWNYINDSNNQQPQMNKHGFSIASIIVGAIGFIYGICLFGAVLFAGLSGFYVVSLILGIVGVVLGILGIKSARGLSLAGIGINAIVILASILIIIFGAVLRFQAYNNTNNHNGDYYYDYYSDDFDDLF